MSTHSARRRAITVALAGLLLISLGLIAWMELGNSRTAPQAMASIKSIIIKRTGHDDITLEKTGATWNMTTPYELIANPQRIDPLLTLGSATFDGYDKTEVDMPATGLDTPAASITIGSREFLLGETDANGERRYTLVDDKVSFVPGWVWSLVHGGVTAFSDLTVFNQLPDEMYLVKGTDITRLTNVKQWQLLQADKIADWSGDSAQLPASSNSESGNTESDAIETVWQLTATDDPNAAEPLANLLRFESHTLINTQPGFAFAISNARLDALLSQ